MMAASRHVVLKLATAGSHRHENMSLIRCPICERTFDIQQSTTMPFCSDRCRQIDLGRWLGEKYSVPVERLDEEEFDENDTAGDR